MPKFPFGTAGCAIRCILTGFIAAACTHSLGRNGPESGDAGQVHAGYVWTHKPPPLAANQVLAGPGFRVQNTHIMGWGPGNPNPSPGIFDFSTLDARIARMRAASGPHTRLMITFCTAPGWMKQSGEDWAMEDRVASEHFADFALLCGRVAERYPDVLYFQVWNEMKGFYDAELNRWQYEDYTRMYNRVWTAVKAARPDALIGGPYITMNSGSSAGGMSHPSDLKGDWGVIDRRALDTIDYFLENAAGYDFICMDGGLQNRFGTGLPVPPEQQIGKFLACLAYARGKTSKLLVWSETYAAPADSYGYTTEQNENLFMELLRRTQSQVAGETWFLIWGAANFPPQPADYSTGKATRFIDLLNAWETPTLR